MEGSDAASRLLPEQKRVMLWAPPRSLSTAFERCLSTLSREGHTIDIFHEPYTTAYHLGPEHQHDVPIRALKFTVEEPKYTYSWIKKQLEQDFSGKEVIFVKDLGYSIHNRYEFLPDGYVHTILLRDPAKIFSSYEALLNKFIPRLIRLKLSKVMPKGWVFQEIYELYVYLTETLGQKVIIIDSEDLINNPEEMLETYCNATGIPYVKDMTKWCKGKDDLKKWHFSKGLMFVNSIIGQYDRALSSLELSKPTNRPTKPTQEYTGEVKIAIEHSMPYYNKLYEKRLLPSIVRKEESAEITEASASACAAVGVDEAREADEITVVATDVA